MKSILALIVATALGVCALRATATPQMILMYDEIEYLKAGSSPTDFFSYQGELQDNGVLLTETVNLAFAFFEVPSGGTAVGTTTILAVPVTAGRFSTSVFLAAGLNGQAIYVEVRVQRQGSPTYVTLGRQSMSAAPYARYAAVAGFSQAPWLLGTGSISYPGKVGIGTPMPIGKLHIEGVESDELSLYGTGSVPLLHFRNNSNSRDWVFRHDGTNFHLQREDAPGFESMTWDVGGSVGIGATVPGARLDVASNNPTFPVLRARNQNIASNNAVAIQAEVAGVGSGGSSSIAVSALATSTLGVTTAVQARAESEAGTGLFAFVPAASGSTVGVLSRASSPAGIAVDAWSSAATGTPTALRARVASATAFAGRFEGGKTFVSSTLGVGIESPTAAVHVNAAVGADALRAQIAGSTKLLVHSNGGVHIGANGTPPANGLFVQGAIEHPPITRWYSISGKTFSLEGQEFNSFNVTVDSFLHDGLAVNGTPGNNVFFTAPLVIPHGAAITELRALATDLSVIEGLTVQLIRRAHVDAGFVLMAAASTSNATLGKQTLVDNTILSGIVDNENFAYDVRVFWQVPTVGNEWDIRLNSVRVAYTVTSPTP